MHYLVYKITNQTNGRYYIGAHKTRDKDDGYMGSGKIILQALRKDPGAFAKEILFECSSNEEMFAKERELVTKELVDDPQSYNLVVGGHGGCKMTFEQASEVGKKNILVAHEHNARNGHWEKLGKLNSERMKGKPNPGHSERFKKFCAENPLYWWNNGVKRTRSPVCPGDGWVKGRNF